LRREAYISPITPFVIYHWNAGCYWLCNPLDQSHASFSLTEPSDWQPNAASIPVASLARIRSTVYLSLLHTTPPDNPVHSPTHPEDFTTYIHTQPLWEQHLLEHIEWVTQPFQAMHLLNALEFDLSHLLIVSDGLSFESDSMSFGVTLGTTSGIIIAENRGPAFGRPSSHRAECTGCLSGALLLYHLQKFTQIPLSKHLQLIACSDNNGMITSLTDRTAYDKVYHNATLVSDWDHLRKSIRHIQKSRLSTQSSNGCGDTKTPPQIPRQLNIRADCLAGEYHNIKGRRAHPQTPLMHHTRCILQIKGSSTHAKYRSAKPPPKQRTAHI
jgi:hypothetical protein